MGIAVCEHMAAPSLGTTAVVSQAFMTSRLDYCSVMYMGLPLKMLQKFHLVQNAVACLLTGTGQLDRACDSHVGVVS